MAEAFIVDAVRTAGGTQGRPLEWVAPGRPCCFGSRRAGGAYRHRPGSDRRCDHGLRRAGGRAVEQYRAQRGTGVTAAGVGAGYVDRSAMRIVAAGTAFCGTGGDGWQHGCRDRCRCREHDAGADGPARNAAVQARLRQLHEPGDAGAVSKRPVQPVRRRRDAGRQIRTDEGRAR